MFKKYKIQFLLLLFLLIGGVFIQVLLAKQDSAENQRIEAELQKSHEEVVLRIETGINVYATVVSSIRSFIKNSDPFPSELQLQSYLNDLVTEIDFKDSIVVSFIDTSHTFQYVVTPSQVDPIGLKKLNVKDFRSSDEIQTLDSLMMTDDIHLYSPINLREGWAAFPFDFAAKDSKGVVRGYVAPVLSVKYLLSYSYKSNNDSLFVHQFSDDRGVDFSREVVYDDTPIYNKRRDYQFYKNFNIKKNKFVYSKINFYGLQLKVGTAYKKEISPNNKLAWITYLWYFFLWLFVLVFLFQYAKNNKLRLANKNALISIEEQNEELASNLENTQVLIKEVHHRVKNNMQIMTSLMNLQSNESDNAEVTEVLEICKGRIQSMALVHEKLYSNKSLASIRVKDYVVLLVGYIERAFDSEKSNPEKRINIDSELFLNTNTMIPLGLILNELLTNSYKHAFGERESEWIEISIIKNENKYILSYSDSGPGIPEEINHLDSESLGMELIHMLAEQLNGNVRYNGEKLNLYTIQFEKIDN